jgi:maleylacetoacetate isomerase/maleylpyruvate isomerase
VQRHGKKDHPFIFGDTPGIAEICLIPQMFNARRFEIDLSAFPRLLAVEEKCLELSAFQEAAPDRQPDAA